MGWLRTEVSLPSCQERRETGQELLLARLRAKSSGNVRVRPSLHGSAVTLTVATTGRNFKLNVTSHGNRRF